MITHVRSRKSPSLRTVLLLGLLAIGPLQAQAAYACAMMDAVVHHDCCCDDSVDESDHLRSERATSAEGERTPCCDVSVKITVDQETRQDTPVFKPSGERFDPDSGPALVATFDRSLLALRPPASYARLFARSLLSAGSDTWLVTRRLRI